MKPTNTPHVLWIPSWYPTEDNPINGIFFEEQAHILNTSGIKVGVVYPSIYIIKELNFQRLISHRFQTVHINNQGVGSFVHKGWYPFFKMKKMKLRWWINKTLQLTKSYIEIYGKPDLIHAQSALWGGCAALAISNKYQIPYLITEHSSLFLTKSSSLQKLDAQLSHSAFQSARRIVTVGNSLKDHLKKMFSISPEIIVIPNPVNTEIFTLPTEPKPDRFGYLYIGILEKRKNVELLIHAFELVLKKNPYAFLEIGGDGTLRDDLKKIIQQKNLTNKIILLGQLNRKESVEAYKRAHAFVLPSTKETFGIVLIEALSTGIPVIATNSGGPADIVTNETGCLTGSTAQSLASGMISVHSHYSRYTPSKIRDYAKRNFGHEQFASQYSNLYLNCLN